jgi:hypothetical protein
MALNGWCWGGPWWGCMQENVAESPKQIVLDVFGFVATEQNGSFDKVIWQNNNHVQIRDSLDYVYAYGEETDEEPRFTDGDHILLFPQDSESLCDPEWLLAAYPFLNRFRSNFTFYPQQALLYKKVTIVGHPDVYPRIDPAMEEFFHGFEHLRVERIANATASELAEILDERIESGVQFPDYHDLSSS